MYLKFEHNHSFWNKVWYTNLTKTNVTKPNLTYLLPNQTQIYLNYCHTKYLYTTFYELLSGSLDSELTPWPPLRQVTHTNTHT